MNRQAFGQTNEADLVNVLRRKYPCISLVAEQGRRVVGHILFSPVKIESGIGDPTDRLAMEQAGDRNQAMGLAPMAVLPECQRQGIGSQLVTAGLAACHTAGYGLVVVLGHPEFYPRFGFVPASTHGLRCEYDVPDPVFMVVELAPGAVRTVSGTVKYAADFAGV